MKKIQEILKDIESLEKENTLDAQRKLNATKKKYERNEMAFDDLKQATKEYKQKIKENAQKDNYLKCYANNLHNRLWHEVLPKIVEELRKYSGKDISDCECEIMESLKGKGIISKIFHDFIIIYAYNDFEVGIFRTIYGKRIIDYPCRKIIKDINMNSFQKPKEYIEDIEEFLRIDSITKRELEKQLMELQSAIREYNSDLPVGFERIEI